MKTMLIVPAQNEEKNITNVITKMKKYVDFKNIVVIDDGSKDHTYEVVKKMGCVALKHSINIGKGGALKTGCDYALKHGAGKMICIDSDGQHDPKHIPLIEKKLDEFDVVYTHRGYGERMPFVLKIGNNIIKYFGLLLHGVNIKDPSCGYRGFTSNAYKKIRWTSSGYAVENEMVFNVKSNNLSFIEIPIKTIYKDKYKGTNVLDGIKICLNILWWKVSGK